ncbi:hypothetical protein ACIPQJ_13100 [Streptomyces sp. NPDC090082]|uniref:hypothetical protein n=1 Tax=unclassified Streptomyces TaxID=2593676 RepID=UPI003818F704
MTSVLFVHGIGARGDKYAALFERVRARLAQSSPEARLLPCRWGDRLGATLNAGGDSLPVYEPEGGSDDGRAAEAEWSSSQWLLLEADPLHELRLAVAAGPIGAPSAGPSLGQGLFGPPDADAGLVERAAKLAEDPVLADRLEVLGIQAEFGPAVVEVTEAGATREALRLPDPPADLAPTLARAILAQTLRRTAEGPSGAVPVLAEDRVWLVAAMTELLGAGHLSPLGGVWALSKTAARTAWKLRGGNRRSVITDAAYPLAGDVMLYLSRGERIREFIAACCRDAEPPIVLMGHSLGGIAALDLLATRHLPEVRALVTVGSQGPFLYELDALPSLPYGTPLPDSVPPWTNFYDPRDLLSYVGERVFPGRVTDVSVPSGNAFPSAHGDYFGNPAFYQGLAEILG